MADPGTDSVLPPIQSPCVSRCEIDPVIGLCEGCARSLDEIAQWGSATPAWRAAIMAALPGRRVRGNPPA
ncbi:DUF1289 domain-containing protein [Sphingomonas sp.]|uniref:DUF1289 domain-containing protein n=1 Tax=Sphingomonas sp. TaxID=28214 RepID=UPI00356421D9